MGRALRTLRKRLQAGDTSNRLVQLYLSDKRYRELLRSGQPARKPPALAVRPAKLPEAVEERAEEDEDSPRVHKRMCQTRLLRMLQRAAPEARPAGWHEWDNVISAHRTLLNGAAAQAAQTTYPDEKFSGRGIIVPAGGICPQVHNAAPYFWLAMIGAAALRATGCRLPVQFWFLAGELKDGFAEKAAALGVECVDASEVGVQQQMRIPGGWQLKASAILACPWREVILMDADNMVASNPEALFDGPVYKKHRSLFWSDDRIFHKSIWDRLGVAGRGPERAFETGQIVVDKKDCWQALQLAKHFADYSDYWGGSNGRSSHVWYGDTGDFLAAWRKTGTDFWLSPRCFYREGCFLHTDYRNKRVFQHCSNRKNDIMAGAPPDFLENRQALVTAATTQAEKKCS